MNPQFSSSDPAGFAKMNAENFSKVQKELGEIFEEANRHWMARAKSETDLASDLIAKLANTRSIPDVAAIYQEWVTQRMQRLAEDSQKFVSDSQKLVSAWTKAVSSGGVGPSS